MKSFFFATILFFSTLGSAVASDELAGQWYDPKKSGHGIQINRDGGFGHAVTWYLYRKDGSSAFLTAGETCKEFPCVVPLHEPTSRFLSGETELGDPVGYVELTPQEDGTMDADYDLRIFLGEECFNISGGGLLFRQCIGKFNMVKLAD